MQKYVPGFENAYVSSTGIQIGVRESRHIVGDYVLQKEDVVEGKRFAETLTMTYHREFGLRTAIVT